MMEDLIQMRLVQLIQLWRDPTPGNLCLITTLCAEISPATSDQALTCKIDPKLLLRLEALAGKAERVVSECVAIHTRSGSYSTQGAPELLAHVATLGWEG